MANGNGQLTVLATTAGTPLAKKICQHLSCDLGKVVLERFKDQELNVKIGQDVRGRKVYIIAPTPAPAENFFEAALLCDAAHYSSAQEITLVVPYLGYARADRKDEPRKPIAVKLALSMLGFGQPNRIIFLDLHAEQTLAATGAVHDHLYGSAVAVPHIKQLLEKSKKPYIVAAPDHGAATRANKYARFLSGEDDDIVIFSKRRTKPGVVAADSVKIIGSVRNKLVILVDDMIDSGGTIAHAAAKAKEKGATGVWVFATHAVFSDGAFERIRKSKIDKVFVTDSIYHDPEVVKREGGGKIEILSCAPLLAQAIRRTHEEGSLTALIL